MGSKKRRNSATGMAQPDGTATAVADRPRRWRGAIVAMLVCTGVAAGFGATWWFQHGRQGGQAQGIVVGDGTRGPAGMVHVPGGDFLMGSDSKMAQANEKPAHKVRIHGFWMDQHHVTNAEFRKFVQATGYVTTAEKRPTGKP